MTDEARYKVDGLWEFVARGAVEPADLGAWLAHVRADCEVVLKRVGLSSALLAKSPELGPSLAKGSPEYIAADLLAHANWIAAQHYFLVYSGDETARSVESMIEREANVTQVWKADGFRPHLGSWAPERDVRSEWKAAFESNLDRAIDGFAMTLVSLATRYAILIQLESTEGSAAYGRARRRQVREASRAGADVQRRENWRIDARSKWQADPNASLNSVAAEIARRYSTDRHTVDKSSVIRSIRDLRPAPARG